jgi:hypothetical protein
MTLTIVGAGMAGLIAARLLRHRDPVVVEARPSLPNNHHAVLRFRTSTVGDVCGIPFRKVKVIGTIDRWRNPAADALRYSYKCGGGWRSDRSIPLETEIVERWIAPPDFIARLAKGVDIRLGEKYDFSLQEKPISTIPMPDLARILGYRGLPEFEYQNGVVVTATIPYCDAHVSVYVPDPGPTFTRISITGDQLMVEYPTADSWIHEDGQNILGPMGKKFILEEDLPTALTLLGMDKGNPVEVENVEIKPQNYSKIVPIDEGARRTFIHWASSIQGKAFSLGRFATWRPGLLADDLIQDVRVIEALMDSTSSGYDAEKIEINRTAGRR